MSDKLLCVDSFNAKMGDMIISYKDIKIYYTFKDNDDANNSPSEYWFAYEPSNNDSEFDIRELSCYDSSLDNVEILKRAIDLAII